MEKKIAPSEHKAQALYALVQGPSEGQSGEELLSLLVRLWVELNKSSESFIDMTSYLGIYWQS